MMKTVVVAIALHGLSVFADSANQRPATPDSKPPTPVVLTPTDPAFDRFMLDHALQIQVRSTDGRVVRRGAGVISSDAGYVMTSLELVVGGTEYLVTGPALDVPRSATALEIGRAHV